MNEPELEARLEDVHERMPALFRMIRQRVSAEQLAYRTVGSE